MSDDESKLVWKIDSIPTSSDLLELTFSLIVEKDNPSQTDLTSKVTVKATDVITGEQILTVGEPILLNQVDIDDTETVDTESG